MGKLESDTERKPITIASLFVMDRVQLGQVRTSNWHRLDSYEEQPATGDDWCHEVNNDGSLRHVDLHTRSNGWVSPPGRTLQSHFFSKKQKASSDDWLLKPAGSGNEPAREMQGRVSK
ncbi:hypothetical protein ACLOJK_014413 [Asimina triloba]